MKDCIQSNQTKPRSGGGTAEWGCQTITCLRNESHILKTVPFSSLSNRFPNIDLLTYKVSQIIVLITCLQIENFVPRSLILILPISFSYLCVLPEISSIMDRNNNGYLRCISDFKGKDSKVVSMVFTVHISQILLIKLRNFSICYSLLSIVCNHEEWLIFHQMTSLHLLSCSSDFFP